jgi:glutamine amidotransferase
MRIYIPNYGCGNLSSVARMVTKVGGDAVITTNALELTKADKIIIAGVGAFDHGMLGLRAGGWIDEINEAAFVRKIPILGICLGMQLMCKASEEGLLPGLGWIDAEVRRFDLKNAPRLKVPHMGWNKVVVAKENPLISLGHGEQRYYFVHSYHVVCNDKDDILATGTHGFDLTAAFRRDNIFGVQFHPEKSHRFGMELMRRFLEY